MSVDVWASAAMPSGPAALPVLRDFMAFMVSCFVGGLVLTSKGPFINYGSGGAGGELGGASKKITTRRGWLPKLFCLMRGGGLY